MTRLLIGSEGRQEPVLRVKVPVVHGAIGDDDTPTAAATLPRSAAGSNAAPAPVASGTVAGAGPAFEGVGNLRIWVGVIGGGVLLIVLTFTGLMLWTRRSHF